MNTATSPSTVKSVLKPLAGAMPIRGPFERRLTVLGVAAISYVAIFLARQLVVTNSSVALGLLFVIPVALVGLELGLWAGVGLACATILIVVFDRSSGSPTLNTLGDLTRAVALLSVGVLAGYFSDRMRAFQRRQAELLVGERERAALLGELHYAHGRLQDQLRNAGYIIDLHDQERRGIAEQLHEQAAQAMAAALLVVGRLERDIVDELTQAQLQRVRRSVHESIAELRRLAGSLHSPVLEELGLHSALERLLEREREESTREIDVTGIEDLPQLPADVEISAYRAVEEALKSLVGTIAMRIEFDDRVECLLIVVEGVLAEDDDVLAARLTTARARLEMVGGSLGRYGPPENTRLTAAIPLRSGPGLSSGARSEEERQLLGEERPLIGESVLVARREVSGAES